MKDATRELAQLRDLGAELMRALTVDRAKGWLDDHVVGPLRDLVD